MVSLIVLSLIGILLLLIHSVNTHRAELYDKDEDQGSYSKYEDNPPPEKIEESETQMQA